MFQYIPFTKVFKIAFNSYGSYGSESCSFGTFDLNCSIDLNSWTIWFRWNLLSPSWIEFGIHPWCTPLISAHCITIPPKTSSSSSSSSPSSSSPSSGKKQNPQNDNHANAKREGRLPCNKKDIPYKGFSFATRPPLKRFSGQKRFSPRATKLHFFFFKSWNTCKRICPFSMRMTWFLKLIQKLLCSFFHVIWQRKVFYLPFNPFNWPQEDFRNLSHSPNTGFHLCPNWD